MKLIRMLLIAVILVFTFTMTYAWADNLELLKGRWTGTMESAGPDGITYYQDTLVLEVLTEGKGKLYIGSGRQWETPVEVRGEKVFMIFGREKREFTLSRKDGILLLETRYPDVWQGWSRWNTISLKKE